MISFSLVQVLLFSKVLTVKFILKYKVTINVVFIYYYSDSYAQLILLSLWCRSCFSSQAEMIIRFIHYMVRINIPYHIPQSISLLIWSIISQSLFSVTLLIQINSIIIISLILLHRKLLIVIIIYMRWYARVFYI